MVKRKAKTKKHVKKRIRWGRLIIVLLIIVLIAATLTQFLYYYFKYQYGLRQKEVYDMKIKVSDYVGFNVDPGELNFGSVTPSGGSKRTLELSAAQPTKVEIILQGELAPWVQISENNFVFEGNKTVIFRAIVPADAEHGEYVGRAIILFKKG